MERKTILDFISQNYSALTSISFKEMTIFLYGKDYQNDPLASKLLDGDKLFAYNVKLPRIFLKTFPLEKMFSGLLDFAKEIDSLTCFKKEDFNFDLEEVYSRKNIKDLDFNYLYFYPIIKNGINQGLILIYALEYDPKFNLTPTSVTLMFNGLVNLEITNLKEHLISTTSNFNNLYYVINEKNNDLTYVCDSLKEVYNLDTNYLPNNDKRINEFMNHYKTVSKSLTFPFDRFTIFFLSKDELKEENNTYLHLNAIKELNFKDEFSLIFVDFQEEKMPFKDFVKTLNILNRSFMFACEDDYYLLYIEKRLSQKEVKHFFKEFDCYYLLLSSSHDVTSKMDFIKLVRFLKETRPIEFIYNEYLEYNHALCNDSLMLHKNLHVKKDIVSSINNETQFKLLNYVAKTFKYIENALEYEKKTINKLNSYIKTSTDSVAFAIMSSSLNKRKFIEVIKKYKLKNISLLVIIHNDEKLSKEELIKALTFLKLNNCYTSFDSSFFMNLEYTDVMKFVDGIYINSEEFVSIDSSNNKFIKMFVNYYFKDNKKIILEQDICKELTHKYEDELIYFVKEREGKLNEKY